MPTLTIDHIKWLLLTSDNVPAGRACINTALQAIAYGIAQADSDTRDLLQNLYFMTSDASWADKRDDSIFVTPFYLEKECGF